ncbi:tryptophan synthase beta chain, partial [Striga asiatica]
MCRSDIFFFFSPTTISFQQTPTINLDRCVPASQGAKLKIKARLFRETIVHIGRRRNKRQDHDLLGERLVVAQLGGGRLGDLEGSSNFEWLIADNNFRQRMKNEEAPIRTGYPPGTPDAHNCYWNRWPTHTFDSVQINHGICLQAHLAKTARMLTHASFVVSIKPHKAF